MTIPKDENSPELIFRDSFNYDSQKLDSLVKAFNLPVEPKMYFPHMYNLEKNYDTILPHLPPKDNYLYRSKKPNEKKAFEKWYEQHYNDEYNFNEVIAEYWVNDVEILTHALVTFRKTLLEITRRNGLHGGIDIIEESMTIYRISAGDQCDLCDYIAETETTITAYRHWMGCVKTVKDLRWAVQAANLLGRQSAYRADKIINLIQKLTTRLVANAIRQLGQSNDIQRTNSKFNNIKPHSLLAFNRF